MTDETPSDTRAHILRVALNEFATRGYHATSLREIAERVGITKTAVLYHFPAKADILEALAAPMLNALEAAVAAAELASSPTAARWAALEGLLDVWLAHRYLLRMNLHDLALAAADAGFARFRDAMTRANAIVAGPRPSFADRVRAAQAVAMLSDPVVLWADAPADTLRAAVLDGVHRLLAPSHGLPSTNTKPPATRPKRGRPSTVDAAMEKKARRLYEAGRSADAIATELGISRATVYRHLGAK